MNKQLTPKRPSIYLHPLARSQAHRYVLVSMNCPVSASVRKKKYEDSWNMFLDVIIVLVCGFGACQFAWNCAGLMFTLTACQPFVIPKTSSFPHFVHVWCSVLLSVLTSVTHASETFNSIHSFLKVGKSSVCVVDNLPCLELIAREFFF